VIGAVGIGLGTLGAGAYLLGAGVSRASWPVIVAGAFSYAAGFVVLAKADEVGR
jgi:hypothetical protein